MADSKEIITPINLGIIKELCTQKGITLKKLAQDIDISQTGLTSAIKNNGTTLETLWKIANYLGVSVGLFFGEENKMAYSLNWRMGVHTLEESLIMIVEHYTKKTGADKFKGVQELFEGGHILEDTFGRDRSTADTLLFSWINIFRKSGTGEEDFLEWKNSGVISSKCCAILRMLADANYNFEEMLRTYEIYMVAQKYNN